MEKKAPKFFKPVDFPSWYKRLSSNFRHYFKQQLFVDVIFYCQGGESIGAHRLMLWQSSNLFRTLTSKTEEYFYNEDNVVHISVPEVTKDNLSDFIEAIYLGAVPTNYETFYNFQSLSETFQVFKQESSPLSDFEDNDSDESMEDQESLNDSQSTKENEPISNPSESSINSETTIENKKIPKQEKDEEVIQYIKGDHGFEVIVVEKPAGYDENQDIELQSYKSKDINMIQNLQVQKCAICHLEGLEHRILIHSEEDKTRLGIPIVPANEALKFIYRCCIQGCPFQALRHLKNATAFHMHMQKHAKEKLEISLNTGMNSSKKCPLCTKPRILHRNKIKQVLNNKETERSGKSGHIYRCCKCSASKLSAKKFIEHTSNHISKKFACSFCQKGFSQQRFLDKHVHVEHGEGKIERFHCHYDHCNFDAKFTQTLQTHIKEKHEGEKREHRSLDSKTDVTCPTCGKTLKKWYYQTYHKTSCNSNVVYKCDHCGQDGFVNNTTLQNHIKAKHSSEKPYACEHCPARYATSMSLSSHRSRVHRVNKAGEHVAQKFYPCDLCGKVLSSKHKRDTHVKTIHQGVKDYECPFCSKRFTTHSNLKVHLASLHTGIMPYNCSFCQKGFTRKKTKDIHETKCTNVQKNTSDITAKQKHQGIVIVPEPSPYITNMGDMIL